MVAKANKKPEVPSEDLRYFPRWEVRSRVLYQLEKNPEVLQAQTKDLSCAGACIKVDRPIQKQKITMTVFLSCETSVILNGEVLWSKNAGDDVEIGVNFRNVNPQAQDLILQYAFEVKKNNMVGHWFSGWDKKEEV